MRVLSKLALAALLCFALPPGGAGAETIVAGLSQSSISITADFAGTEIMVFGAVKRESPIIPGRSLRVVITVAGPEQPQLIRRKDRVWGIWMNNDEITAPAIPSYYAVATSAPLEMALSPAADRRHRITLTEALNFGIGHDQPFLEALARIRIKDERYLLLENSIAFTEETLFRTDVSLPATLSDGNYTVRLYLTRNGEVIDQVKRTIWVRKAGLERFLYEAAHQQPLWYGLASLAFAALAGWAASVAFARLRW